jgi:predicted ATP-dependent Lon-type protease
MKLATNKFKSGGLHEKHVVATWNLGNELSICFRHRVIKKKLAFSSMLHEAKIAYYVLT